jgi:hypothetical protein
LVDFTEIEIESPSDEESVWRYMGLAQYVSMLKDRAIYFSPLSAFDDPFEGSSPYNLSFESVLRAHISKSEIDPSFVEVAKTASLHSRQIMKDATCVSCWYLSQHESDAMWKLYGRSHGSIAIKSNCGALRTQMPAGALLGKVRYLDFSTFVPPPGPITYDPTFLKRKAFEHENEVRIKLEISKSELKSRMSEQATSGVTSIGKSVQVDLAALVEYLVINPTAPQWIADCVRDLMKRYNLDFEIRHSVLEQLPTY